MSFVEFVKFVEFERFEEEPMAKSEFPGFHGWTVEQIKPHNLLLFRKPMTGLPAHKHGAVREYLTVIVEFDPRNPSIGYERGKQDAYESEALFAPADDKALVEERLAAQKKKVIGDMVLRNLEVGATISYAIERLSNAGFSAREIDSISGTNMAED